MQNTFSTSHTLQRHISLKKQGIYFQSGSWWFGHVPFTRTVGDSRRKPWLLLWQNTAIWLYMILHWAQNLVVYFLYYPGIYLPCCFNLLIPKKTETDQFLNWYFQLRFHWFSRYKLRSRNNGHELKTPTHNYIQNSAPEQPFKILSCVFLLH